MNIYEKLQTARVGLQKLNLKKTGKNKFSGYSYYELGDFLPAINQLMLDNKFTGVVNFCGDVARLTLVNCEKPEETIVFESPMKEATLKGAHPIQNLGAVETYSRRYLYMAAFEIVESDAIDNSKGADYKKMLSDAISEYIKMTGRKTEDVKSELEKQIGKSVSSLSDNEITNAVKIIDDLKKKFTESLNNIEMVEEIVEDVVVMEEPNNANDLSIEQIKFVIKNIKDIEIKKRVAEVVKPYGKLDNVDENGLKKIKDIIG